MSAIRNVMLTSVLFACTPFGPVDVTDGVAHVGAGANMDTHNWDQSEVALTTSHTLLPIAVAGFNDYSITTIGPPEFDFTSLPYLVRRGASEMGWSTTGTIGSTWDYRGKVRPVSGPSSIGGWSYIGSDPSIATDANSLNTVYYAHLGVSDAVWNHFSGGADTVDYDVFFGGGEPIDGLCIAKSTDGGITFAAPSCFAPTPDVTSIGNQYFDRTAITVDGAGRVYVATKDVSGMGFLPVRIRVIATAVPGDLTSFTDITPFERVGGFEPRLRTSANGDVWLGAIDEGNGVLLTKHAFTDPLTASAWAAPINASVVCGSGPGGVLTSFENQAPIGGGFLRNEHTYDFDLGTDETGVPMFGLAFQLTRPSATTTRYIQGARLTTGPVTCLADADLSTVTHAGSQVQPSVRFSSRVSTTGAPSPTWTVVYYTDEHSPDPTQPFIEPQGEQMFMAETCTPACHPVFQFEAALAPTSWYACPDTDNYWGDFFDVTQISDTSGTWWNLAAFTNSLGAPPCSSPGYPQHLSATRW